MFIVQSYCYTTTAAEECNHHPLTESNLQLSGCHSPITVHILLFWWLTVYKPYIQRTNELKLKTLPLMLLLLLLLIFPISIIHSRFSVYFTKYLQISKSHRTIRRFVSDIFFNGENETTYSIQFSLHIHCAKLVRGFAWMSKRERERSMWECYASASHYWIQSNADNDSCSWYECLCERMYYAMLSHRAQLSGMFNEMLTNSLEIIILHCLKRSIELLERNGICTFYQFSTYHVPHQNAVIIIEITIIGDDTFNAGRIWFEFIIMRSTWATFFTLIAGCFRTRVSFVSIRGFRWKAFSCAVIGLTGKGRQ